MAKRLIGLLFLSLFVTSYAYAGATTPDLDRIVRQFDDVAFGHEHGATQGVVQKWQDDLWLAFFAQPDDVRTYLPLIRKHIEAINALTGMGVLPARAASEATLRFGFYERADFRKLPRSIAKEDEYERFVSTSACIAIAVKDPKQTGRIVGAAIAVGLDISEGLRRHCILEELVQTLGLPNDACHYRPSLFCEFDRVEELTPADEILLRTLYDERLLVGMSRAEAMPLVRQIVAEQLHHRIVQPNAVPQRYMTVSHP